MKLTNIFLTLLAASLSWGCFEDESSEAFQEKLNIRVEGVDKNIRVNTSETLKLTPKVLPEGRDYSCFWGIAKKDNQWAVIDTLCHEKDLDFKVNLKTGGYVLRFYAEDRETGIFSFTEYNLSVETDMAVGWWMLKDKGNETDIDLFTPDKKKENVIATVNGRALQGQPVDMTFTPNYWVYDEKSEKDLATNAVFVASGNDVVCLDYFTGGFLSEYDKLFFDAPAKTKVDYLFKGVSDTHVVIDNVIYTMPNMKYDHYRQFAIKHTGDYQISRQRCANGWGYPYLFDDKTSSFCTLSRNSLELDYLGKNGANPHRDLNMDMVFMGGKTPSSSPYNPGMDAMAILKQKNENKYYLAHLTGNLTIGKSPMKEAMKEIPANYEVLKADVKALNQDNDMIYFFKENQLWAYDCTLNTEKSEDFTIPADEKVTYMEYTKYTPWGQEPNHFKYMIIATEKGGNYKVTLHSLQAGHLLPAEKVMEGKGKVTRAIYMDLKEGFVNTSTYF